MDLKGLNVLIDGYNIELAKGTGIKTYGITLIHALRYLNANINILFSSYYKYSNDPILNEILFFDVPEDKTLKSGKITSLIKFLKGVNIVKRAALDNNVVIKNGTFENYLDYVDILSQHNCYQIANKLYKSFNITTAISVPKKIDIWHITYPIPIRIRKAKMINTVHDLIPLRLPYSTLDDKKIFYECIKNSLKKSDITITISESTKNDILNIFDINPEKIHVTYQPIRNDFKKADDEVICKSIKKYNLFLNNYILFVGAIEPKKNLKRLIDAYSGIDTDMPLVIIGKKGWMWADEISDLELFFGKKYDKKIKLLDHVSFDDLNNLYSGAYCFVFPSLYEGFGLPPLEAMSLGCPVITSNTSSLPEVCGDAALYANPYDVQDIRSKIEKMLSDPKLRNNYSVLGKERAKLFSMDNYTKRLYEAYSKIL